MSQTAVESYTWGEFPNGKIAEIIDAVENALPQYPENPNRWKDFQVAIQDELRKTSRIRTDVQLENLKVPGAYAEIDVCLEGDSGEGILVHLSGRQAARHEKELLEIISVVTAHPDYGYGAMITRSDNRLKSQGSRTSSYGYCRKALLSIAEPVLRKCGVKGLLIIGYNAPEGR